MTVMRAHWIATAQGRLYAQSWTPDNLTTDAPRGAPIVMLHDSLGCVSLWRDFPERLADVTGRLVIAYDRLGFGQSDARPGMLPCSFVADEATGDFNAIAEHFGLQQFLALGHSVGGGMSVGIAARYPDACLALVTLSAQTFVEPVTRTGIEVAREQFAKPGQVERLARYHGEKAGWVLSAWIDTWLSEPFRDWSLDWQLPLVKCPVLSIHGDQDEYGSLEHPRRITGAVAGPATLHIMNGTGHFPHREQPDDVLAAVAAFVKDI